MCACDVRLTSYFVEICQEATYLFQQEQINRSYINQAFHIKQPEFCSRNVRPHKTANKSLMS